MHIKKILFIVSVALLSFIYYLFPPAVKEQVLLFKMRMNEQDIGCQSTFFPTKDRKAWFIEQLQFFVSDLEVGSNENGWNKLELVNSSFQTDSIALIGESCLENHDSAGISQQSNWKVRIAGTQKVTNKMAIRFKLGVPFSHNHLNPIMQKSPLNLPSMFWVWQTGHKFMRIDLATSDENWAFHLGSTQCQAASALRAPKARCKYPNLVPIELPINMEQDDHDKSVHIINFNLAQLLNGVELSSKTHCQSDLDVLSCQQLFTNLGHDTSSSKEIENTINQSVFSRDTKGGTIE